MARKKQEVVKDSPQIEEGLYLISPKAPENTFNKSKAVYTILGKHKALDNGYPSLLASDDDLDIAYAKYESVRGKYKFFIKLDAEGALFNPISPEPNTNDHKFRVLKNQGNQWQYQQVSQDCFYQYLEFLKTKNTLYLKYAQRIVQ